MKRRALLFLVLLLAGIGVYELTPLKRLKARHEALIEWARSGSPGDFTRDFASSSYSDQWGHSPADVAERVRAVRFAYRNLIIEEESPTVTRSGSTGTVVQKITVQLGDGETRVFTVHCAWERENFLPWSWKLRRVEAPDLVFRGHTTGAQKLSAFDTAPGLRLAHEGNRAIRALEYYV